MTELLMIAAFCILIFFAFALTLNGLIFLLERFIMKVKKTKCFYKYRGKKVKIIRNYELRENELIQEFFDNFEDCEYEDEKRNKERFFIDKGLTEKELRKKMSKAKKVYLLNLKRRIKKKIIKEEELKKIKNNMKGLI